MRSVLYGQKSEICPTPLAPVPCYEECEHTDYVFSQTLPFIGNPFYLESLLRGQLRIAENLIEEFCSPLEICKLGEVLGFSCVQCDYVQNRAYLICPPDPIVCGDCQYDLITPCHEPITNICDPELDICQRCTFTTVDFSTAGPLFDIYSNIVNALIQFNGIANWLGIDQMAKLIFGNDAKVIAFQNGTYYVFITVTETIRNALLIIKNLLPVPIGANIEFVENEVCA